jgi:hypothetical protein
MTSEPVEACPTCSEGWRPVGQPVCDACAARNGTVYRIEHDGFIGEVIGSYVTREGKSGVVLQQIGTRVVHVYGKQWLGPPSREPAS